MGNILILCGIVVMVVVAGWAKLSNKQALLLVAAIFLIILGSQIVGQRRVYGKLTSGISLADVPVEGEKKFPLQTEAVYKDGELVEVGVKK